MSNSLLLPGLACVFNAWMSEEAVRDWSVIDPWLVRLVFNILGQQIGLEQLRADDGMESMLLIGVILCRWTLEYFFSKTNGWEMASASNRSGSINNRLHFLSWWNSEKVIWTMRWTLITYKCITIYVKLISMQVSEAFYRDYSPKERISPT